jgi:hypothetical protein
MIERRRFRYALATIHLFVGRISKKNCNIKSNNVNPGNTNRGGRLSTVDLLIKLVRFVIKANNIFILKMGWSKKVSTRRSTVLSLSLK